MIVLSIILIPLLILGAYWCLREAVKTIKEIIDIIKEKK